MKKLFILPILALFLVLTISFVAAYANPATVNLGEAGKFAILSKTAISNVPASIINGDVGISPAAGTYITGLTCPEVTGTIHVAAAGGGTLACQTVDPAYLTPTILEMQAAYSDANSRAPDVTLGGSIGGLVLTPGVYFTASSLEIPTDVTLDCTSTGPSGVFIFQIGGNLDVASSTDVVLTGNCQPGNIFWAVAGTTNIGGGVGTESTLSGTVLGGPATSEITVITGSTVNGRLLGEKTIALDGNTITVPAVVPECTNQQGYKTIIAGKIYDGPNFEEAESVEGATVYITCSNIEKSTLSLDDGTYSVTFCPLDRCINTTASAYAKLGDVTSNTQTAEIWDYTEEFDLYLGVINIALIPEFGLFIGALTLFSAVGIFFLVRRK